ncbi:DCC1-like thiol-disulfide oxidoreductase family protein [Palleronia caenipelagi]|uniref:DUF393 domain-containing protein n=1 Tax=Palleronia caenipelagi TaxID=2489174 RepID=A0A547Q8U5_9RHOB|nr:DCC1-like thiol-disulfide oxidoreductase family protein [Palleronia caenipelagi]TRD22801.1 DUF393 domain-containing protein [Palleronia caenipelagi]
MTNQHLPDPTGAAPLTIVYDGDCPFCASYVRMVRLRETTGPVEMVNAREDHPILSEIRARNLDLDQGMVVRYGDQFYYGSDAISAISLLSTRSGLFNRAMRAVFEHPGRARVLYPWMVKGRNTTLRLLRRKPISASVDR